jgi:hypothetical protein
MFVVCDFQFRGVDDRVVGSEEGESDGEEQREAYRGAEAGVDGFLVYLFSCVTVR